MANLTVRNLSDETHRALRVRAALNGRSTEAEIRSILDEAARPALASLKERENQRADFVATLEEARASVAQGQGREVTKASMRQLASEVKERGRARLLAELTDAR